VRILTIDRNAIVQRSAAGKEMLAQMQNFSRAAETQFKGEQTQLQTEATQLQQQMAILAADVRDQKEKEFTAKEQGLQTRVAQKQADLQATVVKAEQQIEVALEPIVIAIMRERFGTLVLDRGAVFMGTADMDITQTAIDRLDKALPHMKVELVSAPAVTGLAPAAAPGAAAVPRPAAPALPAPAAPARPAAPPAAGK
jgi:outer membrane protein